MKSPGQSPPPKCVDGPALTADETPPLIAPTKSYHTRGPKSRAQGQEDATRPWLALSARPHRVRVGLKRQDLAGGGPRKNGLQTQKEFERQRLKRILARSIERWPSPSQEDATRPWSTLSARPQWVLVGLKRQDLVGGWPQKNGLRTHQEFERQRLERILAWLMKSPGQSPPPKCVDGPALTADETPPLIAPTKSYHTRDPKNRPHGQSRQVL